MISTICAQMDDWHCHIFTRMQQWPALALVKLAKQDPEATVSTVRDFQQGNTVRRQGEDIQIKRGRESIDKRWIQWLHRKYRSEPYQTEDFNGTSCDRYRSTHAYSVHRYQASTCMSWYFLPDSEQLAALHATN